ncbi:hypothetical protein P9112_010515 [Eukaryota sp. TZLM1-RC]
MSHHQDNPFEHPSSNDSTPFPSRKLCRQCSSPAASDSGTQSPLFGEDGFCSHFPFPQPSEHPSTTQAQPTTNLDRHHELPGSLNRLIDQKLGVRCISSSFAHTLLLTCSGEVYGWGRNEEHQVSFYGPETIKLPIKIPISNIVSISAGNYSSLALSSEGKLYGWGGNSKRQINNSNENSLPITPINIPYIIKEVYGGFRCFFALTHEGQVLKMGDGKSIEVIEEVINVDFLCAKGDSFVAIGVNNALFYWTIKRSFKVLFTKFPCLNKEKFSEKSILFDKNQLFVIDSEGDVWKFEIGIDQNEVFNTNPTKVFGLSNIATICGYRGVYSAIDNNGKVFVWGQLNAISESYEFLYHPICVETFTNIEGISLGNDFLFAYNKNTVWAWGRNDKGQLGTGDLIDRPKPVKVFGSEILGIFQYSKQPLDRMFSGLISQIYFEYLQYLKNLFGKHAYTKARFYTKCSISKKVAKSAREVINGFEFSKNPENLQLKENICDLQLRLSTAYNGPKVINTRIKKLGVYYDGVDYDPQIFSFFPNVEVVQLGGESGFRRFSINMVHLSNLRILELLYAFNIEQLPPSLVKLVLGYNVLGFVDLSYLSSLKHLVSSSDISEKLLNSQIPLPQGINRLEVLLEVSVNTEIQLPNLQELIIHHDVPANITEENFPSLKFIQLIQPSEYSLWTSPLMPRQLIDQGLIKSVKLIKNEYLVELSCFPWWIQYSSDMFLVDVFREYVEEMM